MEGYQFRWFYTGGEEYTVTQIEDSTYGYIYKIWRTTGDDEPEQVYPTIYREEAVEVFVQNIIDSCIEYDLNL